METKSITFEQVLNIFKAWDEHSESEWPAGISSDEKSKSQAEYFWSVITKETEQE